MTIKEILQLDPDQRIVTAEGWIRSVRQSKGIYFLALQDGSCFESIQAVFEADSTTDDQIPILEQVTTGSAVTVTGMLIESPGSKQASEIHGRSIILEGTADPQQYPLQKKRHSLEFLREIAHLRPRTNTIGAVMRIRNELSFAVHQFFQERGFFYIHTPIITGVDAEGAGAMFQVTTLDIDTPPRVDDHIDYTKDFFGKQAYLAVTGQLEAEVFAQSMKNVYTFGPTFRAENSNTTRHLSEFWMIEPEMAFCDIHGNMDTAEEFITFLIQRVLSRCQNDMDFFNSWIQKGIIDSLEKVARSKFTRITYSEAIMELEKNSDTFDYPCAWGNDLQSEHEKFLTEEVFKGPVIVTDYPKEIKAFYMKQNEDGKTVRAMDVLVPRLGEIIGGSERESDHAALLARMNQLSLPVDDYEWYLDLRRYGTVRHSGFGLGFERLIQYVTGMHNIRDVIPFPRTVKSIGF